VLELVRFRIAVSRYPEVSLKRSSVLRYPANEKWIENFNSFEQNMG